VIDFFKFQKTYGNHTVLSIPEFVIPPGIHWIKGVNGSGKSTLLKSIAGIIPFDGEIKINGLNLKRNPVASRRQVSYGEAEPVYPVFLTAAEILAFVSQARKSDKKNVKEILSYFGVADFQHQATGGYSSGMLKKLSLCIVFTGDISWILLDEPFAFIDNETEEKLVRLINIRRNEGVNFIITSHHELKHDVLSFKGIYSIKDTQLHPQ
jgi:ABC-2 type transport system ATP-binding protein